jgi:hypothetical protein
VVCRVTEANGVSRSGGRRGPRVIHLPSPRRLLRPEPALLVAALALVGAMNAPVGAGADHGAADGPASTTEVSLAPGADSLRWFDAAERRERGDRLRAMYAVPLPSAAAGRAGPVGPVTVPGSFVVPDALWAAYTAAAAAMPEACHLDPRLLAAIGQVESGSLAGRGLDGRHRAVPPVLGPVLDGGSFASIRDTDSGRWDGDRTWDRAVGPMQFIPSTWARHGRDADGDGVADPQDIEDAALSAAGYLCAGGRDLARPDDLRSAILSYNHSTSYLAAVLALLPGVTPGGGDLVLAAGGSGSTLAADGSGPWGAAAGPAVGMTSSSSTAGAVPSTATSTTSASRPTTSATTSPSSTRSTTASPTSTGSTTAVPTSPTTTTSSTTSPSTTTTTTGPPATSSTTSSSSPTTTSPSPTTTPDPCSTTTTSTAPGTGTATSTGTPTDSGTTSPTPTGTCTATPAPSPSTSSANATEQALDAETTQATPNAG